MYRYATKTLSKIAVKLNLDSIGELSPTGSKSLLRRTSPARGHEQQERSSSDTDAQVLVTPKSGTLPGNQRCVPSSLPDNQYAPYSFSARPNPGLTLT
jgi:hypothetical protein